MPAPIEPPELALLVEYAERPRQGDWSLRSALVRYAQPEPARVSSILEQVRRIDFALQPQSKRIESAGPDLWHALRDDAPPATADDKVLVEVLRSAAQLDRLGDALAAWAIDPSGARPDSEVDEVVAEVTRRLDDAGVARGTHRPATGARLSPFIEGPVVKQLPAVDKIIEIRRAARLNRAIEAYKFFYPTVSMVLNFEALEKYGAPVNRGFLIQLTTPDVVTLTQNSDTPYGIAYGDTTSGPVVVEIPPGAIMGVVDNANFQFVTNVGLVGDEEGKGAKYLLLPPGHDGDDDADGYIVRRLKTNRFLLCARAPDPDPGRGLDLLRTLRLYPLSEAGDPPANEFRDVSAMKVMANPCEVDGTFAWWEALKRALDGDVLSSSYYNEYGLLADVGLRKDRPLDPDAELRAVLTEAAERANEQLAVAAFADDAPERLVWPDRRWEWVVYSEGDDGYYEQDFLHLSVRERWFYQATLETSKMFMHREGAGSIYWLATVDADGDVLDGGRSYRLEVPAPVPVAQFWSVTLYDLDTRSEINTDQFKPVLTSFRDNLEPDADGNIVLHFGPDRPDDDTAWLQTNPGDQWLAYFRLYGPGKSAFDGTWKPSDLAHLSCR